MGLSSEKFHVHVRACVVATVKAREVNVCWLWGGYSYTNQVFKFSLISFV